MRLERIGVTGVFHKNPPDDCLIIGKKDLLHYSYIQQLHRTDVAIIIRKLIKIQEYLPIYLKCRCLPYVTALNYRCNYFLV